MKNRDADRGDKNGFCFGYWPDGSPGLDLAQARRALVALLAERLPPAPCRLAVISRAPAGALAPLAEGGYLVECLSPPEAVEMAARAAGGGDDPAPWQALLVLECYQDLAPPAAVLDWLRRRLAPAGRLVIAGELCQDPALQEAVNVPGYREIVVGLLEAGFRIQTSRFLGSHVLPTFAAMIDPGVTGEQEALHNRTRWRLQRERHETQQLGYQMFVAARDELFIRTYREGDEAAILALFQTAFGTPRSLAHWQWKFQRNPYGRERIAQAVTAEGVLAAHFCGYPVPFHCPQATEKELITFQAGDTMTHPAFRGSGRGQTAILSRIATYFYHRFCIGRVPFIYGFNTGKIRRFGERFLEYEYIPEVRLHSLKAEALERRPLSLRAKRLGGLRVTPVTRIDDEAFDRFFDEVCGDYGMLVRRCADYVRWRYLDCPDGVHRLFALKRLGRMVGWGVFVRRGDALVWGDALFARRAAAAVRYFVTHMVRRVFPGVARVEAWFSPQPVWWSEALAEAGFEAGDEPNRLAPAFRIFDRSFSTQLFSNGFYYTMGDSDLF